MNPTIWVYKGPENYWGYFYWEVTEVDADRDDYPNAIECLDGSHINIDFDHYYPTGFWQGVTPEYCQSLERHFNVTTIGF